MNLKLYEQNKCANLVNVKQIDKFKLIKRPSIEQQSERHVNAYKMYVQKVTPKLSNLQHEYEETQVRYETALLKQPEKQYIKAVDHMKKNEQFLRANSGLRSTRLSAKPQQKEINIGADHVYSRPYSVGFTFQALKPRPISAQMKKCYTKDWLGEK
ncbi:Hypothetical_protein [Hexamita inflata]|uniref:Hypothetical_protein n=1 Tax=Hexamita inflata TaxID=28002 RepID=A0AA86Q7K0_9EUKA|nr:Hypothetical protein HINF_LOCUS38303 [Hexamita inflata]